MSEASAEPAKTATTTTTPPAAPADGPGSAQPTTGTSVAGAEAKPADASAAPQEPKKTPWFQTRIDHLTKEKWDLKRENEEIKAKLQAYEKTPAQASPAMVQPVQAQVMSSSPTAPQNPVLSMADVERLSQQRAQAILAEQQFLQRCNTVYSEGRKEFGGNFDSALANFNMLGGLQAHPALVEAVTAIPNGHQVLNALGNDLDEASRIVSLTPIQMAVELANLSQKLRGKPISSAPAPIKPLNGAGSVTDAAGPDDQGKFESQQQYREWRKRTFKKH